MKFQLFVRKNRLQMGRLSMRNGIEKFRSFNSKAADIKNTNFVRWFNRNKLSFAFPVIGDKKGTRTFPTIESVRAFVLLFRFFIQDNEATSIKNIAENYDKLPLMPHTKERFKFYRHYLNEFLTSVPSIRVVGERRLGKLNNWEILRIFIYGKLAHQNKAQYRRYQILENDVHLGDMYWFNFYSALKVCLYYIVQIAEVNKTAITELCS